MAIVSAIMVPHPPLIVPQVGMGNEAIVTLTIENYKAAADFVAAGNPETLIVTSPHQVMYSDYFHISPGSGARGSFARFGASDVSFDVRYDEDLVSEIKRLAAKNKIPAGDEGERDSSLDHGTMVPLYFLKEAFEARGINLPPIIRIGLSGLGLDVHMNLGRIISQAAGNLHRRCAFIASGDLSHCLKEDGPYGFNPMGPVYDEKIMDVMGRGDFNSLTDFDENLLNEASECGHRSFTIMGGALGDLDVIPQMLSHEDATGVGYGICTYSLSDPCVTLAKKAIETYAKTGAPLSLSDEEKNKLPEYMRQTRAGCFVSIHKANGDLRGCIGTLAPTRSSLVSEILHNAVSAANFDPRFSPISEDELGSLEINVDVLTPAIAVSDPEELDPKKYGIIVSEGGRRGCLLPDLEGVDTPQQQIYIACSKAGIDPTDDFDLERFTVVRHV